MTAAATVIDYTVAALDPSGELPIDLCPKCSRPGLVSRNSVFTRYTHKERPSFLGCNILETLDSCLVPEHDTRTNTMPAAEPNEHTPEQYKEERKRRGTQEEVAKLLDVTRETIARRETGAAPIHRETWLALISLPVKPKPKR